MHKYLSYQMLDYLNNPLSVERLFRLWSVQLEHKWKFTRLEVDTIVDEAKASAQGKPFVDVVRLLKVREIVLGLGLNEAFCGDVYHLAQGIRHTALTHAMERVKGEVWKQHSKQFNKDYFTEDLKTQEIKAMKTLQGV
jgi:hypothetical protein